MNTSGWRPADWLQRAWWAVRPAGLPWQARVVGTLARALVPLYRLLSALHQRRNLREPVVSLSVPVVVVGNIVVGGAGKTPTVIALVQALQAAGHRPLVVSRGHGRQARDVRCVTPGAAAEAVGDEPLLIARRTGVPVIVGADRVAAARDGLQQAPQTTVIVSDDGLQHRALPRQVEVLLFDERGTGNGRLLPAGPMREPLPDASLRRGSDPPALDGSAPLPVRLVLYNAEAPSTVLPGPCVLRKVTQARRLDAWVRHDEGDDRPLSTWAGAEVHAAAGIASPPRFFEALRRQGLAPTCWPLPDHDRLVHLPWPADASTVLVTEKDAVKLAARARDLPQVWVVPLDFVLPPAWTRRLIDAVGPPGPPAMPFTGPLP